MKRMYFSSMLVAGLWLFCEFSTIAAESRLAKFDALTTEAQEKEAAKKSKKNANGMWTAKVGRYTVNSAFGAHSAYRWGLVLDEFTDEALDENVFPKERQNKRFGPPLVYLFQDKDGYVKELKKRGFDEPGWSGGMFAWSTKFKEPALYAWKFTEDEREMRSTIIHEATHQLMFYHVGMKIPTWFNEGFATNLENYDTARRMKANLYYGMYVSHHAASAVKYADKLVPFSRMRHITGKEWSDATDDKANINYTSVWLITNFFFNTKEGRKIVGKYYTYFSKGGTEPKINDAGADAAIARHLRNIVTPCVKYGRGIWALLENDTEAAKKILNQMSHFAKGDKAKMQMLAKIYHNLDKADAAAARRDAQTLLDAMDKEFPDSPEAGIYRAWIDIANDKDPAAAAAQVEKTLKGNPDYYHPAQNYVLASGYFAAKNTAKAKEYLTKAIRDNRNHALTRELQKALKGK